MNLRMSETFHRSSNFKEQLNVKQSHNVTLIVWSMANFPTQNVEAFQMWIPRDCVSALNNKWEKYRKSKTERRIWWLAYKCWLNGWNSILSISIFFRVINIKSRRKLRINHAKFNLTCLSHGWNHLKIWQYPNEIARVMSKCVW